MHIENTMINGRLRVSKISLKFRIPIIYKLLKFIHEICYF